MKEAIFLEQYHIMVTPEILHLKQYKKYSICNVKFFVIKVYGELLICNLYIFPYSKMKIYHKEELCVFFLITVYHHERMYPFICTNQKIFFV